MIPIISFFILSISLCFWSYDCFTFFKPFLPICIFIEVFNSFTLSNYYFPGGSDDEESAWNAVCFSWWLCLNFINSFFPLFLRLNNHFESIFSSLLFHLFKSAFEFLCFSYQLFYFQDYFLIPFYNWYLFNDILILFVHYFTAMFISPFSSLRYFVKDVLKPLVSLGSGFNRYIFCQLI